MNIVFRKSFTRDLQKISNHQLLDRIRKAIAGVEDADNLEQVTNLKKLVGSANFYRIRVGDYRLGFAVEGELVEFIRCLHRRDLYRFFP
jgi:mRNA interferase RelE/StbE